MTPLLCACAVLITLQTQKCRKGLLAPSNLTFLLIAIDKNGFHRMKEGHIYKTLPQIFFNFALGRGYDLSNLVMILPRFFRL